MSTTLTFTVDDIHRRQQGSTVVVGIQSTEGKVYPAAFTVAQAFGKASVKELAKFLGQLANVDGRGFVVSFTSTVSIDSIAACLNVGPAVDANSLELRHVAASTVVRPKGESVPLEGLGLNVNTDRRS